MRMQQKVQSTRANTKIEKKTMILKQFQSKNKHKNSIEIK